MKTKQILFDLLEYLEIYVADNEQEGKELNTLDFIGFLNSHIEGDSQKRDAISGGKDDFLTDDSTENKIATDVSILVSLLFRYAKNYIKKALKDSRINSADEFSFLITLLTYDSLSKQELINLQVMEKTSGIEIINRLIKKGFITQLDDEIDKRSKRIKMTAFGRQEVIAILPQMKIVSKIVLGRLTKDEHHVLVYLLRKLDHFHNDIFMNEKHLDLDDIILKIDAEK
jgi:DNA-binding MarR family transcriptional regulator